MTLWSFKTYGKIDSKTKSYQIQRGFLLLFIFLNYQVVPSGRMPSGSRPFRRFRSMGYATEFHQNLDAVYITKASDQDPSQQSSRASSLLSSSLVASDGECPRATSLQPASLVEELKRHKGAVLYCVQRAVHLGLVTEVLKAWYLWRGVTSSAQAPS